MREGERRLPAFRIAALILLLLCIAGSVFADAAENGNLQKEPLRSYGAIDVVLYETEWCPYCAKARDLLRDMGVSLTEYDIDDDDTRRTEMITKSGSRMVPVIDIEGTILRGFSPEAIKAAVEKQRRR